MQRRVDSNTYFLWGVLLIIYLLTFDGKFDSIDELNLYAITESVVQQGRPYVPQMKFAAYHNPVGSHELGLPIVAAPLYMLAKDLPFVDNIYFVMILNPLIVALSATLIYLTAKELKYSTTASLVAAVAYGLGSLGWPYALSFYREPLVGFLWLVSTYNFVKWRVIANRRYLYSGLLILFLAPFVKINIIFCLPFVLLIAQRPNRRWVWRTYMMIGVGSALGILVLFQLLYHWRTGQWWDYVHILQINPKQWLLRVYGQLFSPVKGLVFYMPVIVLAVPGLWLLGKRYLFVATGVALTFLVLVSAVSFYPAWHGGQSWGPRLLIPAIPLVLISIASLWDQTPYPFLRGGIGALLLISICIQFTASTNDWWKGYAPLFTLNPTPENNVGLSLRYISLSPPLVLLREWKFDDLTLLWFRRDAAGIWYRQIGIGVFLSGCLFSIVYFWWFQRDKPPYFRVGLPVLSALLILQLGGKGNMIGYPGLSPETAQNIAKWVRFRGNSPYTLVTVSNEFHIYFYLGLLKGDFVHYWYSPSQRAQFEEILEYNKGTWLTLVVDHVHIQPSDSGKELEWRLNQQLFRTDAQWFDGYELVRYALLPSAHWTWQPFGQAIGPFYFGEFAINTTQLFPDKVLGVQLQVCKKMAEIPADYKIFLHLIKDDGALVHGPDGSLQYGGIDVNQWPLGDCIVEKRGIYVPPGVPGGTYNLILGVYTSDGPIMAVDKTGALVKYQVLTSVNVYNTSIER